MDAQKPLELILARNLLSSISTPAFLVDQPGAIVFYNEAAGTLLGRRFEETGSLTPEEWTDTVGPYDSKGGRIPLENVSITQALRGNRPAHDRFHVHTASGDNVEIEASAFPIVGSGGFHGAVVIFWPIGEDGDGEP